MESVHFIRADSHVGFYELFILWKQPSSVMCVLSNFFYFESIFPASVLTVYYIRAFTSFLSLFLEM